MSRRPQEKELASQHQPASIQDADCAILEATAGSLLSIDNSKITRVDIYAADTTGAPTGQIQTYKPFNTDTDDSANLRCERWFHSQQHRLSTGERDNLGAERRARVRFRFRFRAYLENRAVLVVGWGQLERPNHHL